MRSFGASQDRIALFDPFISKRSPPWTFPTSEIDTDDLLLDGTPAEGIDSDIPVGAGRLVAAGLVTPVGTGLHQFSYGVEEDSNIGGYFCEVFANAGTFYVSATYTLDKVSYTTSPRPIPGGFETGGEMRLSMINTPPTWQCELVWRGATYTTPLTTIPPSLDAKDFGLSVNGVDLRLHYFIQIASP